MNDNAFQWAMTQPIPSTSAKFVLVALAFHSDAAGAFSQPATVLAQTTELSERSVRNALKLLVAGGFLKRTPVRTPDEGRGPDLIRLMMKQEG